MSDHYIIIADQGHLRIFLWREPAGQRTPTLEEIQHLDFPGSSGKYTARDTDMAGRFQSSKHPAAGSGSPTARTGMSIDERLPMQREEERRRVRNLALAIDEFMRARPGASWDFAAAAAIHHAVIEAVSSGVRSRLRRAVAKDLVHQPVGELRAHFSGR